MRLATEDNSASLGGRETMPFKSDIDINQGMYSLIHATAQVSFREFATLLIIDAFLRLDTLEVFRNQVLAFS